MTLATTSSTSGAAVDAPATSLTPPAVVGSRQGSLTRRLLLSHVLVMALSVGVFAVLAGTAGAAYVRQDAVGDLEATTIAVLTTLPPQGRPDAATLAVAGDARIGVYDTKGTRIAGEGPDRLTLIGAPTPGEPLIDVETRPDGARDLVAYATRSPAAGTPVVVRVAVEDPSGGRARWLWAALAATVMAVGLLGLSIAVLVTRRVARPVAILAGTAQLLGEGGLYPPAPTTGARETDVVATAMTTASVQLRDRLERERRLATDMSHQLSGPLTGALMWMDNLESRVERLSADRLDSAVDVSYEADTSTKADDGKYAAIAEDDWVALREEVRAVASELRRLTLTVEDVLYLARDAAGDGGADPGAVLDDATGAWSTRWPSDRGLTVTVESGLPRVAFSEPALRQVLDVLLDNAVRHGDGAVDVTARAVNGLVEIRVGDHGHLVGDPETIFQRRRSGGSGTGIGLALARSLANADAATLAVEHTTPTTFLLQLPIAPTWTRGGDNSAQAVEPTMGTAPGSHG